MIHQQQKPEAMKQKNLLTSSASLHHQLGTNKSFLKKGVKKTKDLSKTTFALYLLRFNVALQIAFAANIINLALAIATFWYGINSLYCAFGMDCVIGKCPKRNTKTLNFRANCNILVTLSRHHHFMHSHLAICLSQT